MRTIENLSKKVSKTKPRIENPPKIIAAKNGNDAGIIGATLL